LSHCSSNIRTRKPHLSRWPRLLACRPTRFALNAVRRARCGVFANLVFSASWRKPASPLSNITHYTTWRLVFAAQLGHVLMFFDPAGIAGVCRVSMHFRSATLSAACKKAWTCAANVASVSDPAMHADLNLLYSGMKNLRWRTAQNSVYRSMYALHCLSATHVPSCRAFRPVKTKSFAFGIQL
jgi:hypothetical protein